MNYNYSIKCKLKQDKLFNHTHRIFIALMLSTFLIIIVSMFIYSAYYPQVFLPELQSQLVKELAFMIYPKPREELTFILTLLLTPLICFTAIMIIRHHQKNNLPQLSNILAVSSLVILIYLLSSSEYINLYISPLLKHNLTVYTLCLLSGVIFYFLNQKTPLKPFFLIKIDYIIFIVALLAIIIPSFSFRISNLYLVSNIDSSWYNEFEAVFYSTTQVVAGKSLLVDLPTQYGLFSEFLSPIFKLIGLSVFKFTVIMELLRITALSIVFICLTRMMKSRVLILLCTVTICMIGGPWFYFNINIWNPVYQYFPIRFFFPAISLFLMIKIVNSQSIHIKPILLFSIFSSVALLWNLDSGVPVFGAYLLYLASYMIFPNKNITRKNAFGAIVFSITMVLAMVTLFMLYLWVKSGFAVVHLSWLTKYQHIYYQLGFGMLPLNLKEHAWQLILCIYLLGIILALYHWMNDSRMVIWDLLFYLSILGLGLFAYYEGRSHIYNLIVVSWPAIIILFVLCDRLIRLSYKNMLPRIFAIYSYLIIVFGVLVFADYCYALPFLYKTGMARWKVMLDKPETIVSRNLNFIKQHSHGQKSIFILTPNQSVYLGELGLLSGQQGPGLTEIILQQDFNQLTEQLKTNQHSPVFLQLDAMKKIPQKYLQIVSLYKIETISQDNLALLKT